MFATSTNVPDFLIIQVELDILSLKFFISEFIPVIIAYTNSTLSAELVNEHKVSVLILVLTTFPFFLTNF